ncbi:MAG: hypothetical protein MHPSP_002110 [Paramarteilia canceri]
MSISVKCFLEVLNSYETDEELAFDFEDKSIYTTIYNFAVKNPLILDTTIKFFVLSSKNKLRDTDINSKISQYKHFMDYFTCFLELVAMIHFYFDNDSNALEKFKEIDVIGTKDGFNICYCLSKLLIEFFNGSLELKTFSNLNEDQIIEQINFIYTNYCSKGTFHTEFLHQFQKQVFRILHKDNKIEALRTISSKLFLEKIAKTLTLPVLLVLCHDIQTSFDFKSEIDDRIFLLLVNRFYWDSLDTSEIALPSQLKDLIHPMAKSLHKKQLIPLVKQGTITFECDFTESQRTVTFKMLPYHAAILMHLDGPKTIDQVADDCRIGKFQVSPINFYY